MWPAFLLCFLSAVILSPQIETTHLFYFLQPLLSVLKQIPEKITNNKSELNLQCPKNPNAFITTAPTESEEGSF